VAVRSRRRGFADLVSRLRQPVMLHSDPGQTNAERRAAADALEYLELQIEYLELQLGNPERRAVADAIEFLELQLGDQG
jgi:hypothetical protein